MNILDVCSWESNGSADNLGLWLLEYTFVVLLDLGGREFVLLAADLGISFCEINLLVVYIIIKFIR